MVTTAPLYERLAYAPSAHAHTHPARLAAIARAAGVPAADPATARVLELGCAAGWNLLPMAARLPGATFVGLDHAAEAIAEGRAVARELGLGNVELVEGDLLDLSDAAWSAGWAGRFDYVIAHGVWSWVPGGVRARLRDALGALLAPDGVAYVSFNALPGWASRGAIADTMRRHVAAVARPADQVNEALGLLATLAASAPDDGTGWAARLALEVDFLRGTPPSYLFHDHLAPDVGASWVSDVLAELAEVGLAFVGDADPRLHARLAPPAAATLRRLAHSRAMAEHLLDAAAHTSFRRLVLARAGRALRPVPEHLEPRLPPWPGAPTGDDDASDPSDRPEVCPLVRAQLARGHERLTSLRHEPVTIGPRARALGLLADGTRTRAELGPDADRPLADLARKDLRLR